MADAATMSPSERGEVISLKLLITAVNMYAHLMMARGTTMPLTTFKLDSIMMRFVLKKKKLNFKNILF